MGLSSQFVGLVRSDPMIALLCDKKYELKVFTVNVSIRHTLYLCLENMHKTVLVTFSTGYVHALITFDLIIYYNVE